MRTDTGKVFVKLAKFRFALALVTLRKWSTELSLHKRKGFRFSTFSCRTESGEDFASPLCFYAVMVQF